MLILKNVSRNIFFLFLFLCGPASIFGDESLQSYDAAESVKGVTNRNVIKEGELVDKLKSKTCKKYKRLSYYLYVADFIQSFIQIPTSNVLVDSSTLSSKYLAGRAPVYDERNIKVGVCSASFLCMQNEVGIYTDISNYLSIDNGLVISWLTPTTLFNLELDSIVHSMVTECLVVASTKIGFNPYYGKTFNMIVSSDDEKIYFKLTSI